MHILYADNVAFKRKQRRLKEANGSTELNNFIELLCAFSLLFGRCFIFYIFKGF